MYNQGLEFDRNQNILKTLYSPPILTKIILRQAKQISIEAVRALGGIGLFGVELFLTKDDRLLINEVAPRAHNSGHHTIESSETSQFLQQYNVLRSKPLSPTRSTCAAVMFNLLGLIKAFQFLSMTFEFVCIYTLLLLGGLAPLCGIGVVSFIDKILKPRDCKDLKAVSLPDPGPFT